MFIVLNALYTRVVTQSSSILFWSYTNQYIVIYKFFAIEIRHILLKPMGRLKQKERLQNSSSERTVLLYFK